MLKKIAKAEIAFYILPALMAVLVLGTVAQKYLGIYAAHKIFFKSLVFWVWIIPIPSVYALLSLLTLSLTIKFIFFSEWKWKKAGIHLAHLGTLVLLIGGLITSFSAKEGFIILPEGGSGKYIYDYTKRELFIFENNILKNRYAFKNIKHQNLPANIKVLNTCANCTFSKRENADETYVSMAQFMKLDKAPLSKNPEENIAGITLQIDGNTIIVFENMPRPYEFEKDGKNYKIIFGRQQRKLPFEITLNDFVKTPYSGTDNAKSYHSDITIHDETNSFDTRIEMNKPLRYNGYTFYQSSFDETQNAEISVLAVVENKAQIFPYLSTLLIGIGLILHTILSTKKRITKNQVPQKRNAHYEK